MTTLFLAAVLASLSGAQQSPSTSQPTPAQAQPAAASTAPCKGQQPQQHKESWAEKKLKALACKHDANLCDLPSSPSDIVGVGQDAKPCPPTATPASAAPAKAQQPAQPAAKPAQTTPPSVPTPSMVCPPHTTLIPNTPYCLKADHTTVDAIPLPSGLNVPGLTPAPGQTAPSAQPPASSPQPTNPKPQTGGSAALLPRGPPSEGDRLSPLNDTILDRPVLSLSDNYALTWRSLCEGVIITGSPGSGKSSCSGRQLAQGLLTSSSRDHPSGALILTAKAEETQNWIRYATDCGREKDLIVFNAENGHCFDFLHYEWTRPGRGAGDLESIIDFFSTLASIGRKEAVHGQDPFWERGNEQLMRNCIKLLDLSGERISIANIDRVIKSLPTRPNEHMEADWQKGSYCAQLIQKVTAREETLTNEQWSDLDFATLYCFKKWPAFDERPRSSLEMTWSGMADKFLFNPFNRLFCSGVCSFTPEMITHDGKIVICDFPMLEYGHETGRTINVALKLIFQRALLRRNLADSPNPVFIWADEAQYFTTRRDNFFQQTCRGSRVVNVVLTQNILNLAEELGEAQPGSKTKSLLGNLAIKIFHQQNDVETAQYASDLIGKEYRYLENFSGGGSSANNHTQFTTGGSLQLVPVIEGTEFSRLAKPDGHSQYAAAIVYCGGLTFPQNNNSGQDPNYLRVYFSRA